MTDSELKSGSGVFEEFLDSVTTDFGSFQTARTRPLRVSFEKKDGVALSVPYGRIVGVRHESRTLTVSLGENYVRLRGVALRALYDGLHEERVTRVKEAIGSDAGHAKRNGTRTIVTGMNWDSELDF